MHDIFRVSGFFLVGICAFAPPAAADGHADRLTELAERLTSLQANLDHVWMMSACAMVFLMQIGFMLVEAGLVRSKNSINVAQKNLIDFILSITCFGALGFMVMFGTSQLALFGFDQALLAFNQIDDQAFGFFLFQALFCGTAATIMSGVVAERMRLSSYLIAVPIITIVIYPAFGHWTWGNLLVEENVPFLQSSGFIDFAGSTVVHAVGAWIGLAALLIVGPRRGRYDEQGRPVRIQGHSMVLATAGLFLLWLGWMGFNGGSALKGSIEIGPIIAKTVIAGAVGGVAGLAWGHLRDRDVQPIRVMNGVLGGLVAVTAGCDLVTVWGAIFLGVTGSFCVSAGMEYLEKKRLDDAVGAIPVHGFAGVWGTLAVALVAPLEALPLNGRIEQLTVQIAGSAIAFTWTFGTAFIAFMMIDRLWGLRIDAAGEHMGLNQAEHGATLGTGELQNTLAGLVDGDVDLRHRLKVEPGDEAADLVTLFNQHLDNLEIDRERQRTAQERQTRLRQDLEQEKRASELQRSFVSMTSHEFRTPLAIIDGNAQRMERRLGKMSSDDIADRIGTIRSAVKRLTGLMESMLSSAKAEAGTIKIDPVPTDIRAILQDCCDLQQELTPSHHVAVDHRDLPDQVTVDPTSFTQIVTNLLSNAVKYSPEADKIEVHGWQEAGDVFISVRDFGLGIDEQEQGRMFTRYFRATTSAGIAGTGIGLNLAQLLANRHGGRISLTSKKGEGSTFTLKLPVKAIPMD